MRTKEPSSATTLPLFARPPRPAPQPVTVRCSGCPATASTITHLRGELPYLPDGWTACGEDAAGGLALWCYQCWYEQRQTRRPL
jgi:hypothetical protein